MCKQSMESLQEFAVERCDRHALQRRELPNAKGL